MALPLLVFMRLFTGFNAARGFWQSPNKYFGSAENSMLPNAGANARASTARAELNAILTEACFSRLLGVVNNFDSRY